MPKLQAARVTQCGLDFAVVLVDPKLFMNPSELEAFSERAQALFPGVPFLEPLHNSAASPHLQEQTALEADESSGTQSRSYSA